MSAKQAMTPAQAKALGLYEKLVATVPGLERKGSTMPYTSVSGNMFSVLHKDGLLGLRLPADARELQPYFEQSVAYARSLKPKPTTKRSAKKK